MSPYTSIKSVATNKVGFLSFLLAQQFDNLSRMDRVSCPTFILHGQQDKLIPIEQAYQLKDKCAGPTFFLSPPNMTHNDFDFYEDLIRPLMRFLCQINILQTYDNDAIFEDEEPWDGLNEKNLGHRRRKSQRSFTNSLGTASLPVRPESTQLKFGEEFFIPPQQKHLYMKGLTESARQQKIAEAQS